MIRLTAKQWILWSKVVGTIGVLFIIVGVVLVRNRWSYLQRAISTTATITNLIPTKNHDGDTLYAPIYVFTDQHGRSFKIISSEASFPPPGEIGDKIEVLYDPTNPQDSMQNEFFGIWGFPTLLGGFGLLDLIVSCTAALLARRRLAREGERRAPSEAPIAPS